MAFTALQLSGSECLTQKLKHIYHQLSDQYHYKVLLPDLSSDKSICIIEFKVELPYNCEVFIAPAHQHEGGQWGEIAMSGQTTRPILLLLPKSLKISLYEILQKIRAVYVAAWANFETLSICSATRLSTCLPPQFAVGHSPRLCFLKYVCV